jgi:L-ascorbate metabolism protein UlaG (beta-lactamase superfamily)
MKLTFIGHAAFALDNGNPAEQLLVDPFITGNPAAKHAAADFSPATILLTHAHNDHLGDTVEIAKRTGATVITMVEIADWLEEQDVSVSAGNFGGTHAFPGGSAKFVPAWHSSSYTRSDGGIELGNASGFVVRYGGQTIYFAGDTCLFGDMRLIGETGLDLAVIPIGDHFTMGPEDAARAVDFLNPKTVIPCHYNTFPPIRQDGEAFKRMVEQRTAARVILLAPGESTEL